MDEFPLKVPRRSEGENKLKLGACSGPYIKKQRRSREEAKEFRA